jgi:hypothetical protein
MGLKAEKILGVVATEVPAGIWSDGRATEEPRKAVVEWKSDWQDKFYQVYVNGHFAGATVDTEQRRMIVFLPSSFGSSVRIEVFAVDAAQADVDFGSELAGSRGESGRVKIGLLRSQLLPAGAKAEIYFDNGRGQIDYDRCINEKVIRIWPAWQEKCGLGLSRFGEGDFGRDWSAGAGFGVGLFGQGEFGVDAEIIEWVSGELSAGKYKFGIRIIDENGNVSESSGTEEIVVLPAAKGVEDLQVISFDGIENNLELRVKN